MLKHACTSTTAREWASERRRKMTLKFQLHSFILIVFYCFCCWILLCIFFTSFPHFFHCIFCNFFISLSLFLFTHSLAFKSCAHCTVLTVAQVHRLWHSISRVLLAIRQSIFVRLELARLPFFNIIIRYASDDVCAIAVTERLQSILFAIRCEGKHQISHWPFNVLLLLTLCAWNVANAHRNQLSQLSWLFSCSY